MSELKTNHMNLDSHYHSIQGIYAITPNQELNLNLLERAFNQHQIQILQYRHKVADASLKLSEAEQIKQLCRKHHTLFIINDDVELAQKIGADGIHLGKDDYSIEAAREKLGETAIIGASCYNDIQLAKSKQAQGASYVAFGALFPSKTKPDAPHCPLNIIKYAKAALKVPIVGIGGINFENYKKAFDAGCDAVAMVDAIFNQ